MLDIYGENYHLSMDLNLDTIFHFLLIDGCCPATINTDKIVTHGVTIDT